MCASRKHVSAEGKTDLGDKLPGLGPAYGMLIHEHPHQLWHSYGGVGVIQLEGHFFWECIQGPMSLLEPPHYILRDSLPP